MDIGKLSKRITLVQPVTTEDGRGGRSTTWQDFIQVWAEFKRPRFAAGNIQGTPAGLITQGMLIRSHTEIKKGWRVKYNGQNYEVLHVDKSVPGEIMLTTQEIQK